MKKNFYYLSGFVLILILVSSCATLPPEKPAKTWLGILPEKSSLFVCITKPGVIKPLLGDILPLLDLSLPSIQSVIKHTDEMYAAVSIRENESPLFSFIMLGRYSSCRIKTGLSASIKWKKDPETKKYWKHRKSGTMVAQPDSYLLFITNNDMPSLFHAMNNPGATEIPQNMAAVLEQKTCLLYFPVFKEGMIPEEIPINKKKLPIEDVMLSADINNDLYSLSGSFNLIKNKNARLFTTTFRTFIIWLMRNAGIKKYTQRVKVTVEKEYVKVIFTGFTQQEIVRIVKVIVSRDTVL